jgi:hypothetical protein
MLFSFSPVNLEAREIDRKAGLKGTAPASSAIRSENPAASCFSIVILICDVVLQHCCTSFTLPTLSIELLTSICLSQFSILAKNNTGQPNPLTFQQCRSQLQTELQHCASQQLQERYKVTLVTCHRNRNSPKIQFLYRVRQKNLMIFKLKKNEKYTIFLHEFTTKIIFISKHLNYNIYFLNIVSVRWHPLLTHFLQAFLEVLHHSLQHVGRNCCHFVPDVLFQVHRCPWLLFV